MPLTNADFTWLLNWCKKFGYSIGIHRHPKTRANWDNDWKPHDAKSVAPTSPNYRKRRLR